MSLAEWLRSQEKSPLKASSTSPLKPAKSSLASAKQRAASSATKPTTPALFAPSASTTSATPVTPALFAPSSASSSSGRSPSPPSPAADVIDISLDADSPTKRSGRLGGKDSTAANKSASGGSRQSESSGARTAARSSRASPVKRQQPVDDEADEDEEWTENGDSSSIGSSRKRANGSRAEPQQEEMDDDQPLSSRTGSTSTSRKSASTTKSTSASSSSSASTSSAAVSRGRKRKAPTASPSSTEVSSDASVVLRHVHSAISHMQRSESKPVATLASLGLSGVKREVALMDEDAVRCQIEKVFLLITDSILASEGFSFDIPVRSGTNQLYVPELNRIVLRDRVNRREFASYKHSRKAAITARVLGLVYELCQKRIHTTKRDLFYTDVKLFAKQDESDDVLDDAAAMIGCTRTSLNVVASEKGVVVGQISFYDSGDFIDCTKMGVGGKAIPPLIDRVTSITGAAKFVLLVEKDAAFMRLAEDRFYNVYPCCIITAKGQPDVATRLFLKKVKDTLRIPILGLVDSDPYGLKILSVYVSGSKNMSYDSASLTTADIHWLGVRPSDLERYNIPAQCRLPMTEHDVATGRQMLQEDFIQKNPKWLAELEVMVERREKAEIQALSSFGFQYLSKVFLPRKIQEASPLDNRSFHPARRNSSGLEDSCVWESGASDVAV